MTDCCGTSVGNLHLRLDARFLRIDIQVPIDLRTLAIALHQPLVRLLEVSAIELLDVSFMHHNAAA